MKYLKKILLLMSMFYIAHTETTNNYKSQYEQDKFLNSIFFKNKINGIFIDIGANDGITGSNTWFYEKVLGWKGICFEPSPSIYKRLTQNRQCSCVNACIADKNGVVAFRDIIGSAQADMLSGIESNYDPRHIDRIENKLKRTGGSFMLIDVPAYTLNSVLEENKLYHIDFLSLDIEGGELTVLKSIDFNTFYISAITVENNYDSSEVRTFLESKNFVFIKRLKIDEVYINKSEKNISDILQEAANYKMTKKLNVGRKKNKKN